MNIRKTALAIAIAGSMVGGPVLAQAAPAASNAVGKLSLQSKVRTGKTLSKANKAAPGLPLILALAGAAGVGIAAAAGAFNGNGPASP